METFRFSPDPSPEETAAMVAAIEQFLRDTAPPAAERSQPGLGAWKRAALDEGVSRHP